MKKLLIATSVLIALTNTAIADQLSDQAKQDFKSLKPRVVAPILVHGAPIGDSASKPIIHIEPPAFKQGDGSIGQYPISTSASSNASSPAAKVNEIKIAPARSGSDGIAIQLPIPAMSAMSEWLNAQGLSQAIISTSVGRLKLPQGVIGHSAKFNTQTKQLVESSRFYALLLEIKSKRPQSFSALTQAMIITELAQIHYDLTTLKDNQIPAVNTQALVRENQRVIDQYIRRHPNAAPMLNDNINIENYNKTISNFVYYCLYKPVANAPQASRVIDQLSSSTHPYEFILNGTISMPNVPTISYLYPHNPEVVSCRIMVNELKGIEVTPSMLLNAFRADLKSFIKAKMRYVSNQHGHTQSALTTDAGGK